MLILLMCAGMLNSRDFKNCNATVLTAHNFKFHLNRVSRTIQTYIHTTDVILVATANLYQVLAS